MADKPRAILFGSTTGHGAVMTALSERNLEKDNIVTRICRYVDLPKDEAGVIRAEKTDWGTGNPGLFWGITFPEFFRRTTLQQGDSVIIANIPIGSDPRYPAYDPEDAITCIHTLVETGVTVQIIDHHKTSLSDYGKAHEAGAEIVISSSSTTTHYGDPDADSMFWGRIAAISDRDRGERYPEPMQREIDLSRGLDWAVKESIDNTIEAIKSNNIAFFDEFSNIPISVPELSSENIKKHVIFLPEVTTNEGFKQLGEACKKYDKRYAVGISGEHPDLAVLVVTNWEKYDILPAALYLGLSVWNGHPDAFSHYCGQKTEAEKLCTQWIDVLDKPFEGERSFVSHVPALSGSDSYYRDIAIFMRSIRYPGYLTQHGWPHVQNVLANIRTLGSLFKVSSNEQKILDWSALLHDVGRGAEKYFGNRIDEMKATFGQNIDDNHSHYSRAMILEWKEQGKFENFLTDEEIRIIAYLCDNHSSYSEGSDCDVPGDFSLLLLLLMIADKMDLDKRRATTPEGEGLHRAKQKEDWDPRSEPHWLGHMAIPSVRIHVLPGNKTRFDLVITDENNATKQVIRLKEVLSVLNERFNDLCVFDKPSEILIASESKIPVIEQFYKI